MSRAAGNKTRARNGSVSIIRRMDGRYALTIELPRASSGKRRRHQSTHRTRKEAEARARKFSYEVAARAPEASREVTVSEMLQHWLRNQRPGEYSSQLNRAWLVALIDSRLGQQKIVKLREQHLSAFLRELGTEKKPSTCAKVLHVLRAALREAVRDGLITSNPADNIKPPPLQYQIKDAWTREEVRRIVRAARAGTMPALILVALSTGARIGELVGARREDYDPKTGILQIMGTAKRNGGRGKTKTHAAQRKLKLTPFVQQAMAAHLEQVAERKRAAGPLWGQRREVSEEVREKQRQAARKRWDSSLPQGWIPRPPAAEAYEPLFPSGHGTPLGLRNVRREWAQVLKEAELEYREFHAIRASFITAALANRVIGLKDLQDVVGHTSPVMTLRYAQRSQERQAQVIQVANEVMGLNDEEEDAAAGPPA